MSDQLQPYTLKFVNETRNPWSFCVYLAAPMVNVPNAQSLAWLTTPAAPTTRVSLTWTLDYGFAWLRTGTMSHGKVLVSSSQVWAADIERLNKITYTTKHGLPTFTSPAEGQEAGCLYVHQDRRVEADKSLVGMAIAGSPAYMVGAQPNVDLIFAPKAEYWVTFGVYEQGEVMNLSEVTNSAKVTFEPNCYTMVARLSSQNLWTVEPDELR